MQKTNKPADTKLGFQKKSFRVLDRAEFARIKGGAEMVLSGEMVLKGDGG